MISDIRDESSDDIRIIIEPKSRNINHNDLMEVLFRLTDLETKVQLNLNVLDESGTPKVMSMKEAIIAWLDHRRNVLVRTQTYVLDKIKNRLEILESYLIVFLNLDKVLQIIREDDDPKVSLISNFKPPSVGPIKYQYKSPSSFSQLTKLPMTIDSDGNNSYISSKALIALCASSTRSL